MKNKRTSHVQNSKRVAKVATKNESDAFARKLKADGMKFNKRTLG